MDIFLYFTSYNLICILNFHLVTNGGDSQTDNITLCTIQVVVHNIHEKVCVYHLIGTKLHCEPPRCTKCTELHCEPYFVCTHVPCESPKYYTLCPCPCVPSGYVCCETTWKGRPMSMRMLSTTIKMVHKMMLSVYSCVCLYPSEKRTFGQKDCALGMREVCQHSGIFIC